MWEDQTRAVISTLFQVMDDRRAVDRSFYTRLHQDLGADRSYLHKWREKLRKGQVTGFELGRVLEILELIEVDPADFFTRSFSDEAWIEEFVEEGLQESGEEPEIVKLIKRRKSGSPSA